VLDVEGVIQYGMCRDVPNFAQRGGRGGRSTSISAIFLLLYEPWALTADLSTLAQDLDDPDQPLQAITKTSKKPERTGVAMYRFVQSTTCSREFLANYLSDKTPTGIQ
jgi:superfamily II DNA helicase RecQ